ncbi:hypothetical protein LCGC14_2727330 [marine sediment metagenome]|uniref:Uncharacterized protein n=1 Tax=marine sediment metagenome TaxID=412755 RepID=A0A0F8Z8G3_9ZZZZ
MARDVNLRLIPTTAGGAAVDLEGVADNGSEIDTEGGFFAIVRLWLGTVTGSTVVCDVEILCSIDGGSTDFHIGQFPTIDEADDDIELARVVYIPKPASGQTVTKVKLHTRTSSGTTPVVPCNAAYIEPLVSLGIPGVDAELTVGVEKLI